MKNPEVKQYVTISAIELKKGEFFNIFAGGTKADNLNNVEISFNDDGVLVICVCEEFADKVKLTTYEEMYGND